MEISVVANNTFGAIKRNFSVFFGLSVVLAGVPGFFMGTIQIDENVTSDFFVSFGVGWLVSVVAAYILQGALVHGAVMDFNGGRANFSDCLSTGIKHFLPLFVIAILTSFGVMLGMLLFIIPGIILSLMWIVAVPVRVVENASIFETFSRSRELTHGNRWPILGLFVLYMVIFTAASMIIALPTGMFAENMMALGMFNAVITIVTSMIAAVGVAAIYYALRLSKEGIGAEALAAAFD